MKNLYAVIPWIYSRSNFIKKLPKQGILLDVGCGPGEIVSFFKSIRPEWKIYGTDIYKNNELQKDMVFFESNLDKEISAKNNVYDAVICTHVFEHLQNPLIAIKEIFRVLKPGGKLYLETPSQRALNLPSFTSVNSTEKVPINFYDDPTHIRPFSPPALVQLTSDVGFKILQTGYARNWLATFTSPITFILAYILRKRSFLVHSVWHTVGWSSYIVVEKPK